MKHNGRPTSVSIIGWVYLAVGGIGFLYHSPELFSQRRDSFWVASFELLAVVSGVFLLRGRNWARWLALAWMAFHVLISVGAPDKLTVHFLFLAVIAWFLFRPEVVRYFHRFKALP